MPDFAIHIDFTAEAEVTKADPTATEQNITQEEDR